MKAYKYKHLTAKHLTALVFGLALVLANDNSNATTIRDGETQNTSIIPTDDTIVFTGAGTLHYNEVDDRQFSTISINRDLNGVGTININSTSALTIDGDIGSATNKINQVVFLSTGILQINGSLYTNNALGVNAGSGGGINFNGNNSTIDSVIGTNANKLTTIEIAGENVTFLGNLFTNGFIVDSGKSATLSSSITSAQLGTTSMLSNSILTLESDATVSSFTNTTSSTLNISAGKQLSGAGALTINGTLNLDVDSSRGTTPMISGNSITIAQSNPIAINLNYDDASFLQVGDTYNFITASSTLTTGLNGLTLSDSSILLTPSITVSGSGNSLVLTQNLNTSVTSKLDEGDLASVNFLLSTSSTAPDINSARTALLKISTQSQLEEVLNTLQVDQSNMLQKTSSLIDSSILNLVEYRLQSLNYKHSKANSVRDLIRSNNKNRDEVALVKSSGLWGEVFGATATQDDVNTLKGYDANISGVTFGLDKVFKNEENNSIWGGTLSYAQANPESRGLSKQKTDISSYQFLLYNQNISRTGLGFFNENFLSIGHNRYQTERTIDILTYNSIARSDFSGMQYGAQIGFGYNFPISQSIILTSVSNLRYFGLQLQDYQEKNNAGLGLKVENDYFNSFTSEAGLRMTGAIGSTIEPQINVSWLSNLSTRGAKSHSTFINGAASQAKFRNTGADLDANAISAGAQLKFKTSQNTSFTFRYDMEKSANFSSHLGSARFGWTF